MELSKTPTLQNAMQTNNCSSNKFKKIQKLIGAAAMGAIMSTATISKADDSSWNGLQLATAIDFSKGPIEGSLVNLKWPKYKADASFVYLGTKLDISENVWVAPYGGGVTGFMGEEWGLGSVWGSYSDNNFNIFAESDLYFSPKDKVFYTYLSGGYNIAEGVEAGIQTEGFDKNFTYGAHVTTAINNNSPGLCVGLQSFSDPDSDWSTAVRAITRIQF